MIRLLTTIQEMPVSWQLKDYQSTELAGADENDRETMNARLIAMKLINYLVSLKKIESVNLFKFL